MNVETAARRQPDQRLFEDLWTADGDDELRPKCTQLLKEFGIVHIVNRFARDPCRSQMRAIVLLRILVPRIRQASCQAAAKPKVAK